MPIPNVLYRDVASFLDVDAAFRVVSPEWRKSSFPHSSWLGQVD